MNKSKKQQQTTIDLDSDESTQAKLDLSVLRKPIITSITGFDEMLRAYADGTEELKQLLSKECDIIYECKVCRNIFRSLANFISHKRVYCRVRFNSSEHFHFTNNGYVEQDISTIIHAEQEINNNPYANNIVNGSDDKSRDISSVVERLLRKQHRPQNFSELNYDDLKDDSSESSSRKSQTLKLDKVSNVAVYQSLQQEHESNDMKVEVNEVHNLTNNRQNNTVLGPDGKVLTLFCASTSSASNVTEQQQQNSLPSNGSMDDCFACDICNTKFETDKMLKLHYEMRHQPSAFVHLCPMCMQSFSQPAAVYRHLSNDHKQSNRKIRMMRDKIIKKRIRADEVVQKPPNRELSNLDLNPDDNMVWMEKGPGVEYQCVYCKKGFERKASYTTHMLTCTVKTKLNRPKKLAEKPVKKIVEIMESEENSNISEASGNEPAQPNVVNPPENTSELSNQNNESNQSNRRKRKRTSKVRNEQLVEKSIKLEKLDEQEEEEVDWNLDDEEEKMKLEHIKKEIIAEEYVKHVGDPNDKYKTITIKQEKIDNYPDPDTPLDKDDDDDNDGLVIDEKLDDSGVRSMNSTAAIEDESCSVVDESLQCTICEKVFKDTAKRNDHVINYHGRQKRFKCTLCEYHGYRRTDTINHLNSVHQMVGGKDTLGTYMQVVMKSVDPELILRQTQQKKQRFLLMRQKKLEKEKVSGKVEPVKIKKEPAESGPEPDSSMEIEENDKNDSVVKEEIKEEPADESQSADNDSQQSESTEPTTEVKKKGRSKISSYGKIVKNPASIVGNAGKDQNTRRPVRNRIKPVNKDFVYDMSGLLQTENEILKEIKEELPSSRRESVRRKCTLQPSTSFNGTIDSKILSDEEFMDFPDYDDDDYAQNRQNFAKILTEEATAVPVEKKHQETAKPQKSGAGDDEDVPLIKLKDGTTEPNKDKENIIAERASIKAATNAVNANRASMYEPQYLNSVSFKPPVPPLPKLVAPRYTSVVPVTPTKSDKMSISSSILEKYFNSAKIDRKPKIEPEKPLSAEQLCKKFEKIHVNSVENELEQDSGSGSVNVKLEPPSEAENEPEVKDEEYIAFTCETEGETIILKELSPAASDTEPKCNASPETESVPVLKKSRHESHKKSRKIQRRQKKILLASAAGSSSMPLQKSCSKKSLDRKRHINIHPSNSNGVNSSHRRMTVLQRVMENKVKKSREQLFKRLMTKKANAHRSNFNIFNET